MFKNFVVTVGFNKYILQFQMIFDKLITNKKNISILLSLCFGYILAQGKVIESKNLASKILGKNVNFSVYLPPNYQANDTRKYPVLYLLHGYSDNETAWVQFGNIDQTADIAIASGEITPMIIVMPDGDLDWYINDNTGKIRWMDMFIQEFIPFIDKEYRTRASSEFRAISGLSMGGYGALIHTIKNPSVFSTCAVLSAAVWTEKEIIEEKIDDYKNPWWKKGSVGKAKLTTHWYLNSVLEQMSKSQIDSLKKNRWYLACGDKDFLTIGNAQLHILMTERKINHEYRVFAGEHNWQFWRTHIIDVLKFVTKSFDRRD